MTWPPLNSPALSLASFSLAIEDHSQFFRHGVMLSYSHGLAHSISGPLLASSFLSIRMQLVVSLPREAFPTSPWGKFPLLPLSSVRPHHSTCHFAVSLPVYLYPHQAINSMQLLVSSINICCLNDNYSGLPWFNLK